MVRKVSILSVMVLVFGFISCKQNVDVKYVSVPVPVITESDTYTIYHLKQNILGSLKPGDYTVADTQANQYLAEGTRVNSIKKDYEGFTAASMAQNENAVYIYYNRNTINYIFNTGSKGKFDDGSTSKKVSGLYGTFIQKPSKTTLVSSDAEKYRFKKWTLADGSNVPLIFGAEDIKNIIATWIDPNIVTIPEGFVEVTGTTITGSESWTPGSDVLISGRSITIPDMYVCDHEVTRGEFKELMGTDPSTASAYDKDGKMLTEDAVLNNPVTGVSWYAAIAYCNKLSLKENLTPCYSVSGVTDWENLAYSSIPSSRISTWDALTYDKEANGYRLPTEAEWEWLARGGENYTYAGSNTVNDVAWSDTNNTGTREVKTKKANGYGLYDMSGNVFEWCYDWGNDNSVSSSTADTGVSSGTDRVFRGGSWYTKNNFCAVSSRRHNYPFNCNSILGFRVVRNANQRWLAGAFALGAAPYL